MYLFKEDQPMYKMLQNGANSLTAAELLAAIMGNSNAVKTKIKATELLDHFDNHLMDIGNQTAEDLMRVNLKSGNLTKRQATAIAAAFNIAKRQEFYNSNKAQIRSSEDAYHQFYNLVDLDHEEFWVLCLNRANRVVKRVKISEGGMAGTVVDARIIFRKALYNKACALILCHNHPSGNLKPSQADIKLTQKIKKAGESLDIPVLDHIIIGEGYYSFADEGIL